MTKLPLFDEPSELAPQAARLAPRLAALAARGVLFGTSSWKYEGWLGSIYSPERYQTRGKLSRKKFESECLEEYATIFPTVCGDFAFYQFPSEEFWRELFDRVPAGFSFSFKVPEEITSAKWPSHARYGSRAGTLNEHFLSNELLDRLFHERLAPHADRIGCLILEFGTFPKSVLAKVEDFLAVLCPFLERLPREFQHAVEIRNPEFFAPPYLDLLARTRTAHVHNAWTRMPELSEQASLPEADTADFLVARALLKRGRSYEAAVKTFEPYERVQEPLVSAREGLRDLAMRAIRREKPAYLFVNNRLEGNAPTTIEALVEMLEE
jgi:uncharacterized protein YecE (DUF72 family)